LPGDIILAPAPRHGGCLGLGESRVAYLDSGYVSNYAGHQDYNIRGVKGQEGKKTDGTHKIIDQGQTGIDLRDLGCRKGEGVHFNPHGAELAGSRPINQTLPFRALHPFRPHRGPKPQLPHPYIPSVVQHPPQTLKFPQLNIILHV
jgi:hypothetical protein